MFFERLDQFVLLVFTTGTTSSTTGTISTTGTTTSTTSIGAVWVEQPQSVHALLATINLKPSSEMLTSLATYISGGFKDQRWGKSQPCSQIRETFGEIIPNRIQKFFYIRKNFVTPHWAPFVPILQWAAAEKPYGADK